MKNVLAGVLSIAFVTSAKRAERKGKDGLIMIVLNLSK